MLSARTSAGDVVSPASTVIEVRVAELRQLFNAIDPSPFREGEILAVEGAVTTHHQHGVFVRRLEPYVHPVARLNVSGPKRSRKHHGPTRCRSLIGSARATASAPRFTSRFGYDSSWRWLAPSAMHSSADTVSDRFDMVPVA